MTNRGRGTVVAILAAVCELIMLHHDLWLFAGMWTVVMICGWVIAALAPNESSRREW
jgi:hypothetical protein